MKVLFIYKGIGSNNENSVVDAQAVSMKKEGITIEKFPVDSSLHGVRGYFFALKKLKGYLKNTDVDIIHAHYSFMGIISSIATKKPVICSLMGSDVLRSGKLGAKVVNWYSKNRWRKTIVKSKEMNNVVQRAIVIPNGVDFEIFKPTDIKKARTEVGFDQNKKHIIFVAHDVESPVKNYILAKKAIRELNDDSVELHAISDVAQKDLVKYYNAADALLMTSLSEGSPNVIKEACACNCPVVTTNVGDVSNVLTGVKNCYVVDYNAKMIAEKLRLLFNLTERSNGRSEIAYLDSKQTALRIKELYFDLKK